MAENGSEKLNNILDWIYGHVKAPDRAKLKHKVAPVTVESDNIDFVAYMGLVFTFSGEANVEGKVLNSSADMLLASPRMASVLLADLHKYLGVRINFRFWQAPTSPPEKVNPVGVRWPAKGMFAYKAAPNSMVHPGDVWSDARGTFVAERRGWAFFVYNVWIKQQILR